MTDEELQQVLDLLDSAEGYDLVLYDGPMIIQICKSPKGLGEKKPSIWESMGPEGN